MVRFPTDRERIRRRLALLVAAVALFALAAPAQAAFPGANGKIALTRAGGAFEPPGQIYTMSPDGVSETQLTSGGYNTEPAWSPDGQKIAFISDRDADLEIYVMNADGTAQTRITRSDGTSESSPAWSPDGTRLVFDSSTTGSATIHVINADGSGEVDLGVPGNDPAWSPDGRKIAFAGHAGDIYVMNPDGSEVTLVVRDQPTLGLHTPDWSPDGGKIAYHKGATDDEFGLGGGIFVVNADGTGKTRLTDEPQYAFSGDPVWSPDGTAIAFAESPEYTFCGSDCDSELYRMRPDGLLRTRLTFNTLSDKTPDWQPLPGSNPPPTYEAPKLATPLRFSLVPVARQCGTQANPTDGQHSPSLSIPSCLPPASQGIARFGPQSSGTAWVAVIYGDTNASNGDQADMTLRFDLSDIRTVAGADYNPNPSGADGTLVIQLRLTDRSNGPSGTSPGTTTNFDFPVPFNCTPSTDPALGSTCALDTSADALNPGMIKENKASVFQVYRLRLNDSGPNGTRGDSDDRLFATEGVYIP